MRTLAAQHLRTATARYGSFSSATGHALGIGGNEEFRDRNVQLESTESAGGRLTSRDWSNLAKWAVLVSCKIFSAVTASSAAGPAHVLSDFFDQHIWGRRFREPIQNLDPLRASSQHHDASCLEMFQTVGSLDEFPSAHPWHLQIEKHEIWSPAAVEPNECIPSIACRGYRKPLAFQECTEKLPVRIVILYN
jgi:hypothetical protein